MYEQSGALSVRRVRGERRGRAGLEAVLGADQKIGREPEPLGDRQPRVGAEHVERGRPRIGERSTSHWSQSEQAAALNAAEEVQQQLAQANRAYEDRFGFIFIVFASSKTPEQMLALLQERMRNTRAQEIENAAGEQRKITRARLEKLLSP